MRRGWHSTDARLALDEADNAFVVWEEHQIYPHGIGYKKRQSGWAGVPPAFSTAAPDTVNLYSGGSGVMTFDVTVPLREIAEAGLAADGFVLTGMRAGDGIPGGDASRIAGLPGAVLHLRTIELPSGRPPARWLARHGG